MSQQWKQGEPGADDDVQMPLGTGESAAADEMYVEKKPRINSSTLTLFATFAAALVALYLLGLQNKPRHADAAKIKREADIGNNIEELLKRGGESTRGLQGDIERLVSILTKYLGAPQTANLDIGGNPFELDDTPSPFAASTAAVAVPHHTEDPNLLKVAQIFKGLKLQSVMIGPTPAALVNNRMVTVGAKFDLLTVSAIEAGGVFLKYKDLTLELKPDSPSMDTP